MDSLNSQLANSTATHAVDILRFDAALRERVVALLKQLEMDLVVQLTTIDPGAPALTAFRRDRLQALLDQSRETIATAYGSIAADQQAAMLALAGVQGDFASGLLDQLTRFVADFSSVTLTAEQLAAIGNDTLIMGAPALEWWERQAGDVAQSFADEMRMGLLQGETNDQLVRRIRGTATARGEYQGGIMDTTTRNAEALVRTSAQGVAAAARRAMYLANQDVVKGVVQVSTLDSRTTEQCIARDGKAWAFPDMTPIGHTIPYGAGAGALHFGCRSTDAPLLKSWSELGINLADAPAGTRQALGGEVPVGTTFAQWLAGRTQAQQDAQLGAGKAALWRAGKITLRDLLDQTGNPLTLEELRWRVA